MYGRMRCVSHRDRNCHERCIYAPPPESMMSRISFSSTFLMGSMRHLRRKRQKIELVLDPPLLPSMQASGQICFMVSFVPFVGTTIPHGRTTFEGSGAKGSQEVQVMCSQVAVEVIVEALFFKLLLMTPFERLSALCEKPFSSTTITLWAWSALILPSESEIPNSLRSASHSL